jgi:Cd2+/Zn2+-exporting ATPase
VEKLELRIIGMDCPEEAAALRKTVGVLRGVAGLDFDILNAKMTVSYDAAQVDDSAIAAAVKKAGLSSQPYVTSCPTRSCADSVDKRNPRLIACLASGILLVTGTTTHLILHPNLMDVLAGGEGMVQHIFPMVAIVQYAAAIIAGAWFVAPKALASLRNLRPDMNLLMTLAVIGAMAIGQWFEAATVSFLFAVALLLESWSVGRARRAIRSLMELTPPQARVVCPHHGDEKMKPVEEVPVGAVVRVRPGERIPLDGVVKTGSTSVNQAPITGESLPVTKEVGDEVLAGTINNEGAFDFTVVKAAADTTIARIIKLVGEAQSRRAVSERWVERFARYYTPAMFALAIATAVIPPLFAHGEWQPWLYNALVILVIACPCALVIATPVSIVAGLTAAARAGVLIKGGAYLELPARFRAIAFDKTGTLTKGQPSVQLVVSLEEHSEAELLARAAGLEANSEHPIAEAIRRRAKNDGVLALKAEGFQAVAGMGAEAQIEGRGFWIGSHRFMEDKGKETPGYHNLAQEFEAMGQTVVAVGSDRHVCGLITVSDEVRPEARGAVAALRKMGLEHLVMLTGDHEGTASVVAEATGIDEYRASLMPEDKVKAVEEMVTKYGFVGMVGDGVNDAPAMAVSTVGIAMGAVGTDAALETADIALMSDDLAKIGWLVGHSRRTLRIIKQNIWFALLVKAAFMAMAFAGVATLWMAIAADMGVSLLVIFNSLRLLNGKVKGYADN